MCNLALLLSSLLPVIVSTKMMILNCNQNGVENTGFSLAFVVCSNYFYNFLCTHCIMADHLYAGDMNVIGLPYKTATDVFLVIRG